MKLKCDEPLLTFAFNFKLRRCIADEGAIGRPSNTNDANFLIAVVLSTSLLALIVGRAQPATAARRRPPPAAAGAGAAAGARAGAGAGGPLFWFPLVICTYIYLYLVFIASLTMAHNISLSCFSFCL